MKKVLMFKNDSKRILSMVLIGLIAGASSAMADGADYSSDESVLTVPSQAACEQVSDAITQSGLQDTITLGWGENAPTCSSAAFITGNPADSYLFRMEIKNTSLKDGAVILAPQQISLAECIQVEQTILEETANAFDAQSGDGELVTYSFGNFHVAPSCTFSSENGKAYLSLKLTALNSQKQ